MKHVFNYRNAAIALLTVFATVTMAPAANATDDKNALTAELKFVGNYKNQPVFELNFNAGTEKEFVVNIRDAFGNSLYKETFNSSVTSKKFMLNTDEIGTDALRFEITGKKSNKTIVYEINQNTRFVEEMLVTKVN